MKIATRAKEKSSNQTQRNATAVSARDKAIPLRKNMVSLNKSNVKHAGAKVNTNPHAIIVQDKELYKRQSQKR